MQYIRIDRPLNQIKHIVIKKGGTFKKLKHRENGQEMYLVNGNKYTLKQVKDLSKRGEI